MKADASRPLESLALELAQHLFQHIPFKAVSRGREIDFTSMGGSAKSYNSVFPCTTFLLTSPNCIKSYLFMIDWPRSDLIGQYVFLLFTVLTNRLLGPV